MFPDSQIAKEYKQNKTKCKYTIQYGVYPFLKDLLLEDLKKMQCSHLSLMNLPPNKSISSLMDLTNIGLKNTNTSKYHNVELSW